MARSSSTRLAASPTQRSSSSPSPRLAGGWIRGAARRASRRARRSAAAAHPLPPALRTGGWRGAVRRASRCARHSAAAAHPPPPCGRVDGAEQPDAPHGAPDAAQQQQPIPPPCGRVDGAAALLQKAARTTKDGAHSATDPYADKHRTVGWLVGSHDSPARHTRARPHRTVGIAEREHGIMLDVTRTPVMEPVYSPNGSPLTKH